MNHLRKIRTWTGAALFAFPFLAFSPAFADLTPPTPPLIPGGFADSNGSLGFFAAEDGGVEAVDLTNGHRAWSNKRGSWPLFTRHGWLAVASPDSSPAILPIPKVPVAGRPTGTRKNALRILFLRPHDGSLLSGSMPLTFPWGDFQADPFSDNSGIRWATSQGYFQLEGWAPRPSRPGPNEDSRAGFLRLHWRSQAQVILGIRPLDPQEPAKVGLLFLDPFTGTASPGDLEKENFGDPSTALPKDWRSLKGSLYWAWSDHGFGWTDKPRPFRLAGGTEGFIRKEDQAPFRVLLERWRPYEPLPPLELARGMEWVPLVGMDGLHLVLAGNQEGRDHYLLCDLFNPTGGSPRELPNFEKGCTWKFTVLGDLLLYVTEDPKPERFGGTRVERNLVALDWRKGRVRWRHKLSSRHEAPPVGGTR